MKLSETTPIDPTLKELGRRIALARKNQRMNQAELARASGLGIATIARIETGQDAQFSSWLKIFSVLGLTSGLDLLLPENLVSPLSEVKRRKGTKAAGFRWGDEQQ